MKLVEVDKNCPQTWCVVGNCFSLQREPEVALKFFLRALQVIEKYWHWRVILLIRAGVFHFLVLLIRSFSLCNIFFFIFINFSFSTFGFQIDPCFTYAHTLYGHELANNEDLDKAVQSFRHSLLHDDRHYNAWWGISTYFHFHLFSFSFIFILFIFIYFNFIYFNFIYFNVIYLKFIYFNFIFLNFIYLFYFIYCMKIEFCHLNFRFNFTDFLPIYFFDKL